MWNYDGAMWAGIMKELEELKFCAFKWIHIFVNWKYMLKNSVHGGNVGSFCRVPKEYMVPPCCCCKPWQWPSYLCLRTHVLATLAPDQSFCTQWFKHLSGLNEVPPFSILYMCVQSHPLSFFFLFLLLLLFYIVLYFGPYHSEMIPLLVHLLDTGHFCWLVSPLESEPGLCGWAPLPWHMC